MNTDIYIRLPIQIHILLHIITTPTCYYMKYDPTRKLLQGLGKQTA